MSEYAKIFRKYNEDSTLEVSMDLYNPDEKKYKDLIIEKKHNGFKQVIINSEIMIEIIKESLVKNGLVQVISFTDNTDEEIIDDVNRLLWKIRENKVYFEELKKLLSWALDKNSIDIKETIIYFGQQQYNIRSNGLIIGKEKEDFFKEIIEPVIRRYL
ncbi:hypothetical protein ACIQVU_08110 [Lysinibacillus sp. NPDC098008]|uniref:hypothetical protein n=1 Tax=Lysinibacillus sp. NPDC098008 TaxID=3364146 RepID=UPI00380A819A